MKLRLAKKINTKRFASSTLPYMTKLLNENEEKKRKFMKVLIMMIINIMKILPLLKVIK